MKIVKYLTKQPKYKIKEYVGYGFHTGWCDGSAREVIPYEEEFLALVDKIQSTEKESDVPVVELHLLLQSYSRGRSSATFSWQCQNTGLLYNTAMEASLEMFKLSNCGEIKGLFTFVKQGTQISLIPYFNDPDET